MFNKNKDYNPSKYWRTCSKHNASKRGYKHRHNLSKGQAKDLKTGRL